MFKQCRQSIIGQCLNKLRGRPLNRTIISICVKRKYMLTHPPTPLFADLRPKNIYTFEH